MRTRRDPDPKPGWAARDPFRCPLCDEDGGTGDRIVYWKGAPAHTACVMAVRE